MRRFSLNDPGFEAEFAAFVDARRDTPQEVDAVVREVLAAVRAEGLPAVLRLAREFDGVELDETSIRVGEAEIAAGAEACAAEVREAIAFAADRIRAYHERQRPADARFTDEAGVELGWRWTPLDSVGIYVPGGRAAYPSTVLMNAVPAKAAGVARIAMVTPPGRLQPAVLAAAKIAGVSEIWRIGGAQAVAALAFGAGPIAAVDKIVGPGNAFVTAAKRQVYGVVGIDALAGPSEIVVVADAANRPDWIAADLLSQAEHDPAAQAILITDDEAFAQAVEAAVRAQLSNLSTGETAAASWRDHGAIIIAPLEAAPRLIDRIAPEHAEFAVAEPERLAERVRHAGAMFLGRYAPEAIGDYVAGSNHVLPTSRAARFSSGLSLYDFLKRTSIVKCDEAAFSALATATVALAEAEGLPAHARSAAVRLGQGG
jgi:histidinol dehydrogenase